MATDTPVRWQPSPGFWPAAALIFLAGAFLRVLRVGEQVIIDDEWHALNAVQDHDYAWIFSHIGEADHSIPLTLLYEWLSHTIGLSEWSMRLPSVLAGLLAMAVLPKLWARWLDERETLLFAGLIAVSPFLVNYARIARPYALLALLAGAAVILAWNWWHASGRSRRQAGLGWFSCAVLAAWINPVSLAVTMAPALWFAGCGGGSALRRGNYRPLVRLLVLVSAMFAASALLLIAPLRNDFASLAVKAGLHRVGTGTVAEALALFSGSGHPLFIFGFCLCVFLGWLELYRRQREFSLYLVLIALASGLAVALTGAAWIVYGIVLARYLIGLLPLFLALAAIGMVWVFRSAANRLGLPAGSGGIAFALALLAAFFAGPLPHTGAAHSQFTHHMSIQFDYDMQRNPVRQALNGIVIEPFYAEIAELHPEGDAVVVEAPWHLESNWNPLPIYQAVHGQVVKIGFIGNLCAGKLYGELRPGVAGMDFDHFIPVRQLLETRSGGDYLVLRRQYLPGARPISMDFQVCETAARKALGEPWRETATALVFRVAGGA
jgi:hypothetical protein